MRPYGWRFNVCFDNGDGDGSPGSAAGVGNTGPGGTSTSVGTTGFGVSVGGQGGNVGFGSGVGGTDAGAVGGTSSGPGGSVSFGHSGGTTGSVGGTGSASGAGGGGPAGGGSSGGGGGSTGGGTGGGGPGGSAGGVGGGGHGSSVSPSLVSILNQLLRGVTNPAYSQQMGTPSQNVAGGALGVGQGGALGGVGDAAPVSPVTTSPLAPPAQQLSPAMSQLAQLAMMHGLLGGLAPGEASPGDTTLGFPALSPNIYGTTVGQDTGVRGGTTAPAPSNDYGGYGLGPPSGAATTMGFPSLSVNRGNFGQPAHGQPGNFGLAPRGSNVSLGPSTDAAAEAAGMNPGMMALADEVAQSQPPAPATPSQGTPAPAPQAGSPLQYQQTAPNNLMNMLLSALMGNPSLANLAGA